MPPRRLISLFAATISLPGIGCTDRSIAEAGDPEDELDPGEQPVAPGAMYSPCTVSPECPDGLCVFPSGEAGFCSAPCAAPTDAGRCAPPPGDQSTTCFDIGLADGSWVCALDCEDIGCPTGMRCEQVEAADGARAICF
jgi:hypothetical protein